MSSSPPTLALNLARLRKARGLTQAALAEASGCSSVAMIESGERKSPRPESLAELARALDVTVSDLFAEPRTASERSRPKRKRAG